MEALKLPTRLAKRDMALPLVLQMDTLFVQKHRDEQGQAPEAHQRCGAHELVRIEASLFLALGKKDFAVPPSANVLHEASRLGYTASQS